MARSSQEPHALGQGSVRLLVTSASWANPNAALSLPKMAQMGCDQLDVCGRPGTATTRPNLIDTAPEWGYVRAHELRSVPTLLGRRREDEAPVA